MCFFRLIAVCNINIIIGVEVSPVDKCKLAFVRKEASFKPSPLERI